jgi:hypothetical protein
LGRKVFLVATLLFGLTAAAVVLLGTAREPSVPVKEAAKKELPETVPVPPPTVVAQEPKEEALPPAIEIPAPQMQIQKPARFPAEKKAEQPPAEPEPVPVVIPEPIQEKQEEKETEKEEEKAPVAEKKTEPETGEGEPELDQISVSPLLSYSMIHTTSSGGQALQYASKMNPGLLLRITHNWTNRFSTVAHLGMVKNDFETVAGVSQDGFSSTSWEGSLGLKWALSERLQARAHAGLGENSAVGQLSTGVVQKMKFTRPEIGAGMAWAFWRGQRGSAVLVPRATFAFPGSNGASRSQGHAGYGATLELTRSAKKFFSATGVELGYSKTRFDSSLGTSTNTEVRLQLNFQFDY